MAAPPAQLPARLAPRASRWGVFLSLVAGSAIAASAAVFGAFVLKVGQPDVSVVLLFWVAGLLLAATAGLCGLSLAFDGLAGLDRRLLRPLYLVAFPLAMVAWVLGALFIVVLFIALLAAAASGGGHFDFPSDFGDYGRWKPRLRR